MKHVLSTTTSNAFMEQVSVQNRISRVFGAATFFQFALPEPEAVNFYIVTGEL